MNNMTENTDTYSPSIGERLRRAREKKGLTHTEASAATKLKIAYLEALEHNRFDELPAPIYTKNFIRIYATYLGLDGQQLCDEFGKEEPTEIDLPPHSHLAPNYYLTLGVNLLLRHPLIALGVLVVIAILLFRMCTSPDPSTPPPNDVPAQEQDVLTDYTPVITMDDFAPPRR